LLRRFDMKRSASRHQRSPRSRISRGKLAWLAGLAALSVGTVTLVWGRSSAQAREDKALSSARELLTAATDWKSAHAKLGCPTVTQLLLDRKLTRDSPSADPWGGRFRIICTGNEVQVRSAGEDGEFQTRDDIALDLTANS
jgi:hypothetical protein